uniref:Uncharacterized protein n=1 Tax=Moniliophthora roreri TaxID=221103 RepID=A0A0W0FK38_MONRR
MASRKDFSPKVRQLIVSEGLSEVFPHEPTGFREAPGPPP